MITRTKYFPNQTSVLNKIISETDPLSLFLFGSYAKNKNTPNSDVDLCLVYKSGRNLPDLASLRLKLIDLPLALDLVAFNEADFNSQKPVWWSIPGQIQQEGVKLYDAPSS